MTADGNGIYSITFNDVLAGDHSFKVVANCDFDSGIDYGAYDGSGNYDFTTSKQSNVTIKFNSNDKRITVHTSPADALIIERYVVSGTATLTGENWNIQSTANEMTFDERTGTFVKHMIIYPVTQIQTTYSKLLNTGRITRAKTMLSVLAAKTEKI